MHDFKLQFVKITFLKTLFLFLNFKKISNGQYLNAFLKRNNAFKEAKKKSESEISRFASGGTEY